MSRMKHQHLRETFFSEAEELPAHLSSVAWPNQGGALPNVRCEWTSEGQSQRSPRSVSSGLIDCFSEAQFSRPASSGTTFPSGRDAAFSVL